MFPYIIGGIAILFFCFDPVLQYFSPQPVRTSRGPRPAINESLLAIDGADVPPPFCGEDAYSIHILNKAPLVIYIQNFVSKTERKSLLETRYVASGTLLRSSPGPKMLKANTSEPLFVPSTITSDGANTQQNTSIRDSSVALLPRDDTVRCIEQRALGLQGHREDLWIERLRTQKYVEGGHYTHHFDWGSGARGWGRLSSMMVWIAADGVEGGGTEFPLLRRRGPREKWCRWVECAPAEGLPEAGDDEKSRGIVDDQLGLIFKPIAGNAVFWENFRPDGTGRGWQETWHAGLPVKKGVKIGLNIWSWGSLD